MVAQAVGDRRRRHVVAEHVAPLPDGHVRRHYGRPPEQVAPAYELEEQVGALPADVEVPQLVDDEEAAVLVEPHPLREAILLHGALQVLHQLRAVCEVDLLAGHDRLVAYRDRQVRLADAGAADEHDVVAALEELQRRELLERAPGHARLEGPFEVRQRLEEREVGHADPPVVVRPPLGRHLGVGDLEQRRDQVLLAVGDEPDVVGDHGRHGAQAELLQVGGQPGQRAGLGVRRHNEPPIESSRSRFAAAAASMSTSPNHRLQAIASA